MSKKSCSPGKKWDSLLKMCMPQNFGLRHPTPTEPPPKTLTTVNPTLWIAVLLVTLGSILALALWLVIYRRYTRRPTGKRTKEQPEEQPPLKTEPAQCAHRESTECEGDWSGLKGSTVRQETVPLPATELVTTKTL
uniref:Uncharacterized protein n=1 Tax=Periophthalmus magnuspinnatus TaxID=409849 RepID=A0A3B4B093_9GOBI